MDNVITLYHRATSNVYAEICDAATTAVVSIADDSDAGFVGAAWGAYSPSDCLNAAHVQQSSVLTQLQAWGLRFK